MSSSCPEFGFRVSLRYAPHLNDSSRRDLFAALMHVAESRGLTIAGGGSDVQHLVIARESGQAIDADRQAIRDWLASTPDLRDVSIGDLVDLTELA